MVLRRFIVGRAFVFFVRFIVQSLSSSELEGGDSGDAGDGKSDVGASDEVIESELEGMIDRDGAEWGSSSHARKA